MVQPDAFEGYYEDFDYVYRQHHLPEFAGLDLGHDMRAEFTRRRGEIVGLIESHRTPAGRECSGAIRFDVPAAQDLHGARWQVQSWAPLTLSPSILCSCGRHGFIRDGQWEPA